MIEIRLLGPFDLVINGRSTALGSGKQRRMLAALALEANRPMSTDRLIGRLWDDSRPASARANVHAYVARLRLALQKRRRARLTVGRAWSGRITACRTPDRPDRGRALQVPCRARFWDGGATILIGPEFLAQALDLWTAKRWAR
jgi:hypothetical protein